jgi:hypothetical protein
MKQKWATKLGFILPLDKDLLHDIKKVLANGISLHEATSHWVHANSPIPIKKKLAP